MKLAAIQYCPPKGRPARARRELVRLATAAVDAGAELIVMPELATTGYVWPSAAAIAPFCEAADGPTFAALAPVAARGATIICGFAERAPDGRLYNSALFIDDQGRLAGCYRKILLFPLDATWAGAGTRRMVLQTTLGQVAPAICMDINDPRLATWLTMIQPRILAFCTNWVEEGEDAHAWWRERLRGWRGWMVAGNRWGSDEDVLFSGRSAILSPAGEVLAQAGPEEDGVVLVDTLAWESLHPPDIITQADEDRWR